MSIQDTLSIFLIVGVVTFTICVVALTYFFIQALKAVQNLADHLKETTEGLKDKVGLKFLAAIPPILVSLIGRIIQRRR